MFQIVEIVFSIFMIIISLYGLNQAEKILMNNSLRQVKNPI